MRAHTYVFSFWFNKLVGIACRKRYAISIAFNERYTDSTSCQLRCQPCALAQPFPGLRFVPDSVIVTRAQDLNSTGWLITKSSYQGSITIESLPFTPVNSILLWKLEHRPEPR